MKLRPFALERFFARYEFGTRYLLCASDAQSLEIDDLLALEPDARKKLGEVWLGYTESRGGPDLRRTIARLYEHGDPESILVHAGSEEPIFAFMQSVVEPTDRIAVQFPCYQSHYAVAESLGARVDRWHSDLAAGGAPDVAALEGLAGPQTRAIVLTTPNNPTGYAFDRAQIDGVVAIARRYGCYVLCDEVYRGSERESAAIPPICDLYERGVSLGGLSKAFGLAGVRIGWISTRDRELYNRMAAIKDYLTICNSAPSEFLAALALRHAPALLERVRAIAAANLDCLDEFFARRRSLFDWRRPQAGTTAFPRYLAGSSEAFCERLVERAGVLLLPSTVFDAGDERVRFGYGRANLPEAVAALDAFVEEEFR